MATSEETIIESLAELRHTLKTLTDTVNMLKRTVAAQEKRLHLVYSAAMLVVGAVGGPGAIQAITGH